MSDGLIRDETGIQRTLGYVLDIGQPDRRARVTLDLDERHTNRSGVLHGGILGVLLDTAMGVTASLSVDGAGQTPMLTISMNVNFLSSAQVGDRLTAVGRVTGGGRKVKFAEGSVEDAEGRTVATATGVFRTVPADRLG